MSSKRKFDKVDERLKFTDLPTEIILFVFGEIETRELINKGFIYNRKCHPIVLSAMSRKTLSIVSHCSSWYESDCIPSPECFTGESQLAVSKFVTQLNSGHLRTISQYRTLEICTTLEDSQYLFEKYYDSFLSKIGDLRVFAYDDRLGVYGSGVKHALESRMKNVNSVSLYSRARVFPFSEMPFDSIQNLMINTGKFPTPRFSLANISVLKNLKTLKLQGGNKKLEGNYLDFSGLKLLERLSICSIELSSVGFLQLPVSLRVLKLHENRLSSMSKTNIAQLTDLTDLSVHQSTCKMDGVQLSDSLERVSLKLLDLNGFGTREKFNNLQLLTIDFKYNSFDYDLSHPFPALKKMKLSNIRNVSTLSSMYYLPSTLTQLVLDCQEGPGQVSIDAARIKLPPHLKQLRVDNVLIENISGWTLPSNLKELELIHFGDKGLLIDDFDFPDSLEKIKIKLADKVSHMKSSIGSTAMEFPSQLRVLHINNINLSQYDSIKFGDCFTELVMSRTDLGDDWKIFQFANPKTISCINLDHNNFSSFQGFQNLGFHSLERARSADPDYKWVKSNLKISVCYNKLSSLDFMLLPDCQELIVSNNVITDIQLKEPLRSLTTLSVSDNFLTTLNHLPFDQLTSLFIFTASNNPICDLDGFVTPPSISFATISNRAHNKAISSRFKNEHPNMKIIWTEQPHFVWLGRRQSY